MPRHTEPVKRADTMLNSMFLFFLLLFDVFLLLDTSCLNVITAWCFYLFSLALLDILWITAVVNSGYLLSSSPTSTHHTSDDLTRIKKARSSSNELLTRHLLRENYSRWRPDEAAWDDAILVNGAVIKVNAAYFEESKIGNVFLTRSCLPHNSTCAICIIS